MATKANFMTKFSIFLLLLGLLLTSCTPATGNPPTSLEPSVTPTVLPKVDPIPNNADGQRFQQIRNKAIAENLSQKPLDAMMQNIAKQFLGSAYQAGLLDKSAKETLVASLTQFDCVLFVETVLALVRGIAVEDYTYSTFTQNIVDQRYRQGKMETYCDRLHYFSEWIADNEKRGNVVNLTPSLGGIPLNKTLNFMTTHRGSYPQMVKNEANYQCIAQVERNLRQLNLTYLPTSRIKSVYSQLKSGDIIAITTNIAGLDVTHTGLVYRQGNQVGLIHASPAGQVTIATDLQKYVSRVPKAIGIFVVRPVDPRL
jgi:Protein of unknown function (DUF1460)